MAQGHDGAGVEGNGVFGQAVEEPISEGDDARPEGALSAAAISLRDTTPTFLISLMVEAMSAALSAAADGIRSMLDEPMSF